MKPIKKKKIIAGMFVMIGMLYLFFGHFDTKETVIAVIDTGIKKENHSEQIIEGWDLFDLDFHPEDRNGHGTAMIETIQEMSPNSQILAIKNSSDKGIINHPFTSIAIMYAIFKGADVVNMSFGYVSWDVFTTLAIKYGQLKGVIFVAAAGNDDKHDIDYPAKLQGVIAVGGYNPRDGSLYDRSNRGKGVDVLAPSMGVKKDGTIFYEDFSISYISSETGTSYSSAYVTGIIAEALHREKKTYREIKRDLDEMSYEKTYENRSYAIIEPKKSLSYALKKPFIERVKVPLYQKNPFLKLSLQIQHVKQIDVITANQTYSFRKTDPMQVPLRYGLNSFEIKGYNEKKEQTNQYFFVVMDNESPIIDVIYPANKKDQMKINVKDVALKKVFVDGREIMMTSQMRQDLEQIYWYRIPLGNVSHIEAFDQAGNRSEKWLNPSK